MINLCSHFSLRSLFLLLSFFTFTLVALDTHPIFIAHPQEIGHVVTIYKVLSNHKYRKTNNERNHLYSLYSQSQE